MPPPVASGVILSQWGKALGAVVIGVVGSEDKAKLAKKNGCKHVLVRGRDDDRGEVKKLTQGPRRARGVRRRRQGHLHRVAGLPAQARHDGELTATRRARCRRSPPRELVKRGSLYLTRPTLFDYTDHAPDLEAVARETFAAVKKKWVKVEINQRYKLADAAQAHRDLEARKTTGASVILPA